MATSDNTPEQDVIQISLANGYIMLVDSIDKNFLQHQWSAKWGMRHPNAFYAARSDRSNGKRKTLTLHRLIFSLMIGRELHRSELVDHINGNTLDNRRVNLRLANSSTSNMNRGRFISSSSGYKGVTRDRGQWRSRIQVDKNMIELGRFDNPKDAALAYNEAAKVYHGEFARLNVLPENNKETHR